MQALYCFVFPFLNFLCTHVFFNTYKNWPKTTNSIRVIFTGILSKPLDFFFYILVILYPGFLLFPNNSYKICIPRFLCSHCSLLTNTPPGEEPYLEMDEMRRGSISNPYPYKQCSRCYSIWESTVATFISTWRKLESSGRSEPQLKNASIDQSAGKPVGIFLIIG